MEAPNPINIPAPIFQLLGGKILSKMLLTDMIISNKKMKEDLGVELKYPTYPEVITALTEKLQNGEKSNDFKV